MKKVLLLGDSIRQGYQEYVKQELEGECEVYFDAEDNGRFVQYNFWQLNQMYKKYGNFDIVHFNSGYWDMTIEEPDREAMNSLSEYIVWLKRIINYVRNRKGIPIFANSAPIFDELTNTKNNTSPYIFHYKNSWVQKYNNVAERLMESEKVYVNNLYDLLITGKKFYKCPDMLHLTEDGYKLVAKKIAMVIRKGL